MKIKNMTLSLKNEYRNLIKRTEEFKEDFPEFNVDRHQHEEKLIPYEMMKQENLTWNDKKRSKNNTGRF